MFFDCEEQSSTNRVLVSFSHNSSNRYWKSNRILEHHSCSISWWEICRAVIDARVFHVSRRTTLVLLFYQHISSRCFSNLAVQNVKCEEAACCCQEGFRHKLNAAEVSYLCIYHATWTHFWVHWQKHLDDSWDWIILTNAPGLLQSFELLLPVAQGFVFLCAAVIFSNGIAWAQAEDHLSSSR